MAACRRAAGQPRRTRSRPAGRLRRMPSRRSASVDRCRRQWACLPGSGCRHPRFLRAVGWRFGPPPALGTGGTGNPGGGRPPGRPPTGWHRPHGCHRQTGNTRRSDQPSARRGHCPPHRSRRRKSGSTRRSWESDWHCHRHRSRPGPHRRTRRSEENDWHLGHADRPRHCRRTGRTHDPRRWPAGSGSLFHHGSPRTTVNTRRLGRLCPGNDSSTRPAHCHAGCLLTDPNMCRPGHPSPENDPTVHQRRYRLGCPPTLPNTLRPGRRSSDNDLMVRRRHYRPGPHPTDPNIRRPCYHSGFRPKASNICHGPHLVGLPPCGYNRPPGRYDRRRPTDRRDLTGSCRNDQALDGRHHAHRPAIDTRRGRQCCRPQSPGGAGARCDLSRCGDCDSPTQPNDPPRLLGFPRRAEGFSRFVRRCGCLGHSPKAVSPLRYGRDPVASVQHRRRQSAHHPR